MRSIEDKQSFGAVADCASLLEAIDLIRANPGVLPLRRAAASIGMVLSASAAVAATEQFSDTLSILNHLSRAKAEIDIAAWHSAEVTSITSAILCAAQAFVEANTIPCTEWPSPGEVSSVVLRAAREGITA